LDKVNSSTTHLIGSFGEVKLATHNSTGEKRAVKIMGKDKMKKNKQIEELLMSEFSVLRSAVLKPYLTCRTTQIF
jgi:serine/threonine protein kinase